MTPRPPRRKRPTAGSSRAARRPRGEAPKTRRAASRTAKPTGRRVSLAELRRRADAVLASLRAQYADAGCALHHRSALELLVATILSAQCTDQRVNLVTPALFQRYPDAAAFAAADPAELEDLIRSTGFFRNKCRSLIGMGRRLVEAFGGAVPDSMDALLTLPGVARKTANCVLGTWFGRNEGVVVDTHVGRLAERLGFLQNGRDAKDAVRIEQDLMALFPRDAWTWLSHALIEHGRRVCLARKPRCGECPLAPLCPSAETGAPT
ncbi:MAG: Endonuclease III [Phycisphaerae bacterium]|nr:Endonuclease III [Phycisphaerae bacterium]